MSVLAGIESMSVVAVQERAKAFPAPREAQPFHFSNPNWLREGRYVQVEWIATKVLRTEVEMTSTSADGKVFTFTRPEYITEEEIVSKNGTITKALPTTGEVARSDPSNLTQTIHFTPEKEIRTLPEGDSELYQPATLVILDMHFGNYIISAARRNR